MGKNRQNRNIKKDTKKIILDLKLKNIFKEYLKNKNNTNKNYHVS